jgi:hypothetical protein
MHVFSLVYPTLAVSLIYCVWHAYARFQTLRVRLLRERICHMLLAAAEAS